MISESQCDRLVQLIYEAAVEPEQWQGFLCAYAQASRSDMVALLVQDVRGERSNVDQTFGADPPALKAYNEYYASISNWIVGHEDAYVPGAITNSVELISDAELQRTEYYADFLRPNDWMYAHGCVIRHDEGMMSALTGLRSRRAGAFAEEETGIFRRLMPHLQCAMRVHQRLAGVNAKLEAAGETLDRMPAAVVITDASRRVLLANAAAERILAAEDGLRITGQEIHAARRNEDRALHKSVAAAALARLNAPRSRGSALVISRPSGRRPLEVLVWPLTSGSNLGSARPAVVLLLSDPEVNRLPSDGALCRLYGLTPAEAKLAIALVQGKTVEEYANEAQISPNTVRSHLKRVFSKMAVERQSELVRQLLKSIAVMQGSAA